MNLFKLLFICFLCAGLKLACAQTATHFPLLLNANKTHLVDKEVNPFLIKEISAWGLIQALSESEESDFMDRVKEKGFSTLLQTIFIESVATAGA